MHMTYTRVISGRLSFVYISIDVGVPSIKREEGVLGFHGPV